MNAIELNDVTVVYKGYHFYQRATTILEHVNLSVAEGEVFGLIGPNGAGKTTLIKTLLGLVFPTKGEVKLFGEQMPQSHLYLKLGYLPEHPMFYPYLTARELLNDYGKLFHLKTALRKQQIDDVLERVGLASVPASKRLGHYSKGMLQRFGVAQAILHNPPLLILDEPMSGLDPMGRHDLSLLIQDLSREGKTIVFVSHILHDVEVLCDRVGILNHGQLTQSISIETVLSSSISGIQVVLEARPGLALKLADLVCDTKEIGHRLIVVVENFQALAKLVPLIQQEQTDIISVNILRDSLEEHFIKTIQKERSL